MPEKGKVVGIAVLKNIGNPKTSVSWEKLYQAIEELGSREIRHVKPFEPFSLVTVIGE